MNPALLRRLEALEQSNDMGEPITFLISPTGSNGGLALVDVFICKETGGRWERKPDEAMSEFVERVEHEAESLPNRPPFTLIAPEPGQLWREDGSE